MLLGMNCAKILVDHMGISHSSLNIFMAKKFLYIDDIGIVPKQIGRERMTKRVRMNSLFQSGPFSTIPYHHLYNRVRNTSALILLGHE